MTRDDKLKEKVSKGILWGGLNTGVQQLLNLIIGIFLARLLTPADYGMVGILTVFSALAGVLQEGGFISALTNKKDVTSLDYNSVFWFSTTSSIIFYTALFFLAPLISDFYRIPELTPLSRFIFLGFVFSSLNITPRTILFKNLHVKEIAFITLASLGLAGVIGIVLAYNGAAYWGLAAQTVSYTFLYTLFTWCLTKWRPKFEFSASPLKKMFGYSSKIVVTNIFSTLNNNLFSVLLGKFYSAGDVGDFNQANKWNTMGYSTINGVVYNVAQPSMATVAEDYERLKRVFRKLLRFTSFVSFPLMFGLSLVSPEFIIITIGEKWFFSSLILQVLCVGGAFAPISYLFSNLLLSQGRSKPYMWITIFLAIFQIAAVFFSYPYGIFRMVYVYISINIIWILVWFIFARKKLKLTFLNFIKDTFPFIFIAAFSSSIAYFTCLNIVNVYVSFSLKLLVLATFYLGILFIFKSRILIDSVNYFRHKFL